MTSTDLLILATRWRWEKISRAAAWLALALAAARRRLRPPALVPFDPAAPLALCVSSRGNSFMREIAEHLCECLEASGVEARIFSEEQAAGITGRIVIVAPHEFFTLGRGPELRREPRFRHAAMLNTEQIGTSWFLLAMHYLAESEAVYELSPENAAALGAAGIPACMLGLPFLAHSRGYDGSGPLPHSPLLESLAPAVRAECPPLDAPLHERPLDVLFVGQATPYRRAALLELLPGLAPRACYLHIPEPLGPLRAGGEVSLSSREVAGLSRRSKVMLNLHRSEQPYFEWHRIALLGFLQKTLVFSHPLPASCGFEPGVHYVSLTPGQGTALLGHYLDSPQGRAEAEIIRAAAYQRYSDRFPTESARALLSPQ